MIRCGAVKAIQPTNASNQWLCDVAGLNGPWAKTAKVVAATRPRQSRQHVKARSGPQPLRLFADRPHQARASRTGEYQNAPNT